jgi:curved DNA-binding protein
LHSQVLDIPSDATDSEIKSAFHKMSRKYHPDKNKHLDGEKEKQALLKNYEEVAEAYNYLADAERKKVYDLWLAGGSKCLFGSFELQHGLTYV